MILPKGYLTKLVFKGLTNFCSVIIWLSIIY